MSFVLCNELINFNPLNNYFVSLEHLFEVAAKLVDFATKHKDLPSNRLVVEVGANIVDTRGHFMGASAGIIPSKAAGVVIDKQHALVDRRLATEHRLLIGSKLLHGQEGPLE